MAKKDNTKTLKVENLIAIVNHHPAHPGFNCYLSARKFIDMNVYSYSENNKITKAFSKP